MSIYYANDYNFIFDIPQHLFSSYFMSDKRCTTDFRSTTQTPFLLLNFTSECYNIWSIITGDYDLPISLLYR